MTVKEMKEILNKFNENRKIYMIDYEVLRYYEIKRVEEVNTNLYDMNEKNIAVFYL